MRTLRRWTARIVGGIIAVSGLGLIGCKQPLASEPADWVEARRPNVPLDLETQPHAPIGPPQVQPGITPATVTDLKRDLRPITLNEAIATAIEQGNQGSNGQDNLGLSSFTGRGISGSDTIKAFVLDPAVAQAEVERSISKFDARWINSMSWNKQDQATLNLQQSFSNGDSASFSSTLAKPLPTGGVAGITVSMNYLNLSSPPPAGSGFVTLNTSYTPRVQFIFEQPLLQGFGVEANQLLANHPGSLLINGFRSTGQGTEGILIARVRSEQTRTQFDSVINQQLLNVELAYWTLYAAYYNLYAQEEGLKQSFAAYLYYKARVDGKIDQPVLLPQSEAQYWQFYNQVVDARGQVLEADRVLRGLLGLKSDDGTIFKPVDEPKLAEFKADVLAAYREGLEMRPEVLIARQELKAQQLLLQGQKILRRPDLRSFASYDVNGLGGTFVDAGESIQNNAFNSWQIGFRLDMPLGFRDANALVRQAQLSLWRTWYQLSDAERKMYEGIIQADRQIVQSMQQLRATRAQRLAVQKQVELIGKRIEAEVFTGDQYITLLDAQRTLATATANEFRFIAQYNQALARLEFAKGTIQQYNRVAVNEGALPTYVQKKAADHYRERAVGFKLREHPADLPLNGLDEFQLAPVDKMTEQIMPPPGGGAAPMPKQVQGLPSPLPAPATRPGGAMAQPAPGSVRPWENTQPQPGSPAAGIPTMLPSSTSGRAAAGDVPAPSASFQPTGTLVLPKRPGPAPLPASDDPTNQPIAVPK